MNILPRIFAENVFQLPGRCVVEGHGAVIGSLHALLLPVKPAVDELEFPGSIVK